MDYIIITPARNEAKFIEKTLQSVIGQTIKPKLWLIVDDGSTDSTGHIVEQYILENDFIRLINLDSCSEQRAGGAKVVQAFNAGFNLVKNEEFDFIVKLDADLILPNNYFEEIINYFESNPKVGLCGGYCLIERDGKYIQEGYSENHVRGAFKSYRKKCFTDIGGLKPIWSWDGTDEFEVIYHGWELKVLPLAVIHLRPTSAEYNLYGHSLKTGMEMYRIRTDLLSLFYLSLKQMPRKPLIFGSMLFVIGYLKAFLKGEPKLIEKDLGRFIRKFRYTQVRKKMHLSRD